MPSPSSTESLAADMAAFLDAALVERVPARDIATAESLCVRAASSWPDDDEGWAASRRQVAEQLADHYDERASDWARALYLMALYLDAAWLDEPHPHAEGSGRFLRRGQQVHRVKLELDQAFAEALLVRSNRHLRVQLFESLDEWDAWRALARALEARRPRLDASDVSALVTRAIEFSWGDGAASTVLDPIKVALTASSESVDAILEGWLGAEEPHVDIDVRTIGVLAQWRLPEHPDPSSLRRRLVHQLARSPAGGLALAPHVAFRSWSRDASLDDRKQLLLATIKQLGGAGVSDALGALAHDPDTPSKEALEILDALVERATSLDERGVIELVRVLRWIADAQSREAPSDSPEIDGGSLVRRLPPPGVFTMRAMPWLDRALSTLARHASEPVRDYVLDLIETFADQLGGERTLDHLLPQTRKALPGGDGWLIEAAVSDRPNLRQGAILCLVEAPIRDDRRAALEALPSRRVEALARLLLSQATAGAAIVDLLFELAQVRPDCLDALLPLLGQPTMQAYPGRHRRCVEAWAKAVEGRPAADPQVEAVASLQAVIELRQRHSQACSAVRELLFEPTLPVREPAGEIFTRTMRESMRAHESPLRAMATKVPIACGEATTFGNHGDDNDNETPLKDYTNSMEGLYLDLHDPIAGMLERVRHEQEAERLLADLGQESTT